LEFPDRRRRQPGQRSWIERGLRAGNIGLDLVVLLPEGHDHVPAQTGVDGEVASRSPAVLSIGAQIAVAQIERLTGGLRVVAWNADQEIGIRVAGFRPVDIEGAVERGVRMLIHLVDVELSADLESVRADHSRESVAHIVRIVDLRLIGDRNAHDEGGKGDVLHALELRRLHNDARRAGPGGESPAKRDSRRGRPSVAR
jgi:hypothetical protein